jgi:hypothetical protein
MEAEATTGLFTGPWEGAFRISMNYISPVTTAAIDDQDLCLWVMTALRHHVGFLAVRAAQQQDRSVRWRYDAASKRVVWEVCSASGHWPVPIDPGPDPDVLPYPSANRAQLLSGPVLAGHPTKGWGWVYVGSTD